VRADCAAVASVLTASLRRPAALCAAAGAAARPGRCAGSVAPRWRDRRWRADLA
jgi:hypothetical protein